MNEIKMTDEIREKMSGLLPMGKDSVYEFTPNIFKVKFITNVREFIYKDKNGVKAKDKKGRTKYEVTSDTEYKYPKEYWPTIKCKQMTNAQQIKLKEMIAAEAINGSKKRKTKKTAEEIISKIVSDNKEYMEMVEASVCGWGNFFDVGTGEKFEYETGIDTLMSIPEAVRQSIFAGIVDVSGVLPYGIS